MTNIIWTTGNTHMFVNYVFLQELKKKAETKLAQIKKQLEGDKESVIGDLSEANNRMQSELEELRSKLQAEEAVRLMFVGSIRVV